ncbi:MAG TPA: 50S ribosomal protein L36 [Candidatus Saccharimonadia bacterium]|nr:50S ribosomal protein L36 [Candidatus Saccharimonadia bacterium]
MKVKASIKARCKNCKSILRHGKRYIVCINPRHKQRQG